MLKKRKKEMLCLYSFLIIHSWKTPYFTIKTPTQEQTRTHQISVPSGNTSRGENVKRNSDYEDKVKNFIRS